MSNLKIIPYNSNYQQDFKRISIEWLEEFGLFEDLDRPMLENPKEIILDKGGYIFLAEYESKIVGTITLKRIDKNLYEILKLGVNTGYQGLGIGKNLMSHCIESLKSQNVEKIILETNTKLEKAIALYKKFNFKEIAPSEMSYDMADFKMVLILKE